MNYYIIGLSENNISQKYLKISVPAIEKIINNKLIFWEGTRPPHLNKIKNKLSFAEKKLPTYGTDAYPFTPSEIAVWYSHYFLWNHIYQTKVDSWIFEHDMDFLENKELPIIDNNCDMAFVESLGSMCGYYVKYNFIPHLIDFINNDGPIRQQVDSYLKWSINKQALTGNFLNLQMKIRQMKQFGSVVKHSPRRKVFPNDPYF